MQLLWLVAVILQYLLLLKGGQILSADIECESHLKCQVFLSISFDISQDQTYPFLTFGKRYTTELLIKVSQAQNAHL